MWTQRFLIACVFFTAAMSAQAFDRPFPPTVKRGVMTPAVSPAIIINDKPRRMTVGARIWNQKNMIEMPAAIRGSQMTVNYTEISSGEIDRVWILTADEARIALPKRVAPAFPTPPPVRAPVSIYH